MGYHFAKATVFMVLNLKMLFQCRGHAAIYGSA